MTSLSRKVIVNGIVFVMLSTFTLLVFNYNDVFVKFVNRTWHLILLQMRVFAECLR